MTKIIKKIYVLYAGQDGYIRSPVGFTYDFDFACEWSKKNRGSYQPVDLIENDKSK